MASAYLPPRNPSVSIFEYGWAVLTSYVLFVLLIISAYRGYKTRKRLWWYASGLLLLALVAFLWVNWEIQTQELLRI